MMSLSALRSSASTFIDDCRERDGFDLGMNTSIDAWLQSGVMASCCSLQMLSTSVSSSPPHRGGGAKRMVASSSSSSSGGCGAVLPESLAVAQAHSRLRLKGLFFREVAKST